MCWVVCAHIWERLRKITRCMCVWKQDCATCWCESVRKGLEKDACPCQLATWELWNTSVTACTHLYVYAGVYKHVAGRKDTMIQQWDCIWDCVKVAESADTTIQHKHIWVCAWVAKHNMLGVSTHTHVWKCVCTVARSEGHRCTSMRGCAKGRQ